MVEGVAGGAVGGAAQRCQGEGDQLADMRTSERAGVRSDILMEVDIHSG